MTKHWQLQVLGLEACGEQMDEDSGQGRGWWWRRVEGKNIQLGYKSSWNEV